MAAEMTSKGVELGFVSSWLVTHGEVWRFLGYNMAIMVLHSGGPKEDLWLQENNAKYEDAVFAVPNLGQYGLDYPRFVKLMRCFTLPTYGDKTDPFDPIRLFTDKWNATVHSALAPGRILTVDESMALWKGKRGKYGGN
jgi:hypothetical protein